MKFVLLRLIQPNETFLSNSLVLFLSHSQYLIIIKILMNFIGFTKSLSKSIIYLSKSARAAREIRPPRTTCRSLYCAGVLYLQPIVSAGAATAAGWRQGSVLGA